MLRTLRHFVISTMSIPGHTGYTLSITCLSPAQLRHELEYAILRGYTPYATECLEAGARLISTTCIVDAFTQSRLYYPWVMDYLQTERLSELFDLEQMASRGIPTPSKEAILAEARERIETMPRITLNRDPLRR